MKRIAVIGAGGRSGSVVASLLAAGSELRLGAALVSGRSPSRGQMVLGTEVTYSSDLRSLEGCDGVVDFSSAEASQGVVDTCVRLGLPLLMATTGHSPEQLASLAAAGERIPVCVAGNTSLGATALGLAAEYVQSMLGERFDIEVVEMHHRMKRDAPSGTAKALTAGLAGDTSSVVFGREGVRRLGEVGVTSVRGGDVVGDHTVFFLGDGERLELTHRAHSREVFARGAITLIERLIQRSPGFYSVRELLLSKFV